MQRLNATVTLAKFKFQNSLDLKREREADKEGQVPVIRRDVRRDVHIHTPCVCVCV